MHPNHLSPHPILDTSPLQLVHPSMFLDDLLSFSHKNHLGTMTHEKA